MSVGTRSHAQRHCAGARQLWHGIDRHFQHWTGRRPNRHRHSLVKARDIVERYSSEDSIFARYPIFGHAVRFLPAFSAAFIAIIGIIITFQAIMQTGIILGNKGVTRNTGK